MSIDGSDASSDQSLSIPRCAIHTLIRSQGIFEAETLQGAFVRILQNLVQRSCFGEVPMTLGGFAPSKVCLDSFPAGAVVSGAVGMGGLSKCTASWTL